MTRFEGKRVFLTGAASGVGKATAELFATEGATVVAVDLAEAPGVIQLEALAHLSVLVTLRASAGGVTANRLHKGHLSIRC